MKTYSTKSTEFAAAAALLGQKANLESAERHLKKNNTFNNYGVTVFYRNNLILAITLLTAATGVAYATTEEAIEAAREIVYTPHSK